jgi:molybdopterin molybdotransferase
MLTVEEALQAVLDETWPLAPEYVELGDALGLVTADEILSDVDSPPFDKALMDGFAVRAGDLSAGAVTLKIIEQVTAGMVPKKTVEAGTATRIMTGAPLPTGADSIVKIEDAQIDADANKVTIRIGLITQGQHVLRRGTSLTVGQQVLPAGRVLRPQELGALAEVGRDRVSVHPRPTVAVLATGDELVEIGQKPGPGQIRNSNEIMLVAQTRRAGGIPRPLGIARDEREALGQRIVEGLGSDVLLLSGGVSEGTHDLVPSELANLGVRKVFHKVNMRPGKPLWFGVWDRSAVAGAAPHLPPGPATTFVFGLPGNPVSSMVCFELFVRTCLRQLMGRQPALPQAVRARLAREHVARGERSTYNPARLTWDENRASVEVVAWHGSSDLHATVDANALAVFPGGDATYPPGQLIDVILLDGLANTSKDGE